MIGITKKQADVAPAKTNYGVEVVYVGESIDLKRVQETMKQYSVMNRDPPPLLPPLP